MSDHMTRRRLIKGAGAAVAGIGLASLVGCEQPKSGGTLPGASSAPPSGPVTLRFLDWQLGEEPTGSAYRSVIAAFEQANPGIKIEAEAVPLAQYQTRVVTQAKAGQLADVLRVFDPWIRGWIDEGFLLDLNPHVDKAQERNYKDLFYAPTIDLATTSTGFYGVPGWNTALMLQYNAKLFQEAGLDPDKPPRTWTELIEYSKKLTKPGGSQYGIALHGSKQSSAVTRFVTWLFNNDVDVIRKDGSVDLDSSKAVETLQYWTDLVLKHKVTPPGVTDVDVQNGRSLFAQRKVAMFQNASMSAYLVANENPGIKSEIRVAPMPTNVSKSYTPQFMSFLSIDKNSKNAEAAWKFVQAFNSKDNWVNIWKTAGMQPARKDAFEDPEVQRDPIVKATTQMTTNVKFIPPIPQWPAISDAIAAAIQQVLANQKTPEAAMKQAADQARTILKK